VRAALAAGAWKTAPPVAAVDYSKPVPGSENLTAQQSQGLMLFRWNNRALAAYRAHSSQKYPYFYPLTGPVSGVSLFGWIESAREARVVQLGLRILF
jgi:hypothetical protein